MPPVVVQPVVPPAVVACHRHHVNVVMLNITRLLALPVVVQPPFHSFLVKIVPSIAVTASRRSAPLVVSAVTACAATAEVATVADVAVIAATIAMLAGKINRSVA